MSDRGYRVFGSFEIPRRKDRLQVERSELREFWKTVEGAADGLAAARGCYIFGIRAGKGAKPWYVGQSKKSFKQECFAPHKLVHYNGQISKSKGTPILLLLARMTPAGRFAKTLAPGEADWVERLLIHHCLSANKGLLNISRTAYSTEVVIPGLHRTPPGNPSRETQEFRSLLNLE